MVRAILYMVIGILVGGSIVYIVIDTQEATVTIDAVSTATKNYATEKVTLPPDGTDYKILGQLTGLKNFTVAYGDLLIRGGEVYHDDAADILNQYGIKLIISVVPSDRLRTIGE